MAKNLKIAIVDDENEILNILEKFLKKQGHSVRTFSNPVVAKDQSIAATIRYCWIL